MVKKYSHFNPGKYGIDVKIACVKSSFHCKYNLNYHFVWIPKYRKHILKDKVVYVLKQIVYGKCHEYGWEALALEVMPDHIHLFLSAKPKWNPSQIINILKGNTSRQLRLCFPELKHLGWQTLKVYDSLWADGYYVGSAGHVSQESVKRYILEQQGKDIFEYSIFSDPTGQSKIGDFT
jgi:putative transposase